MNSSTFDTPAFERLYKRYQKLSAAEQRIMQVLAVVCQPVNQTDLQHLLRDLAAESKGKAKGEWKGLAGYVGKTLRERLLKQGILKRVNNQLICHPLLLQTLSREAVDAGIYAIVAAEVQARWPAPTRRVTSHLSAATDMNKRQLQHAFYLQRWKEAFRLLRIDEHFAYVDPETSAPLIQICTQPLDEEYLASLPAEIIFQVLAPLIYGAPYELEDVTWAAELMERMLTKGALKVDAGTLVVWLQQLMHRGRLDDAAHLIAAMNEGPTTSAHQCWLLCLQGHYGEAIANYQAGLKLLRKGSGRRNDYMRGMPAVCYLLALLQGADKRQLQQAQKFVNAVEKSREHDPMFWTIAMLGSVVSVLLGDSRVEDSNLLQGQTFGTNPPVMELFRAMARVWLHVEPDGDIGLLVDYVSKAQQAGWRWYAREGARVLEALGQPLNSEPLKQARELECGAPLSALIKPVPAWQRSLQALQELVVVEPTGASGAGTKSASRLIWLLNSDDRYHLLAPREQKVLKSGRWSKGRAIALRRLVEEADELDFLSEQDRRICSHIRREESWGYSRGNYELDTDGALQALVGHPLIFWADQVDSPIDLVATQPELQVQQDGEQLLIQLYPFPVSGIEGNGGGESYGLVRDGEHRVQLVQFSRQHLRIAEILSANGLKVPEQAREQVLASINAIAPLLTVHSDIGGGGSGAREVEVDTRPHIHLQPAGEGVRLQWYVRPFALAAAESVAGSAADSAAAATEATDGSAAAAAAGDAIELGPMFRPGEGGGTVFAEIGGEKLQATRALEQESAAMEQLLVECAVPAMVADGECLLDEAESALETLLHLQESERDMVLSWPRGQKIRLSREAGVSQMQLSVRKERDWFALDGQLQLDDERVMELQQLLALMQASPGRFVRLEGGDVLALTDDLRRRLRRLAAYGDGGQFHPLAAEALDDAIQGMELETSEDWREQLRHLDNVRQLEPRVPSTLQAELRDYQVEGYEWLARLAHLGAGACLADDMGLGKTVQALALILSRASQGPTLILAPTSVCMNWTDEAQRFAPTLRVARFGEQGDRQQQIDSLQAFDVLVCSYGLLQNEGERLADVSWHTVVADEAQAIKNAATKRSRAVMALRSDFKMITTGTPIENHLGELWNLFRFINPGLLGSLEQFNRRFATPIEAHNNREVRQQLKQLIRPFILRRMKSDVLTELPARTEVTLHVELDEQEQLFYEAVRREALDRLSEADQEDNPGKQRVKMLAEIMRLRRACCNPKLVMPETTVGSAKLKAFGGVLQELLESRHKALVFSQFVGHLALLREFLEEREISYQYLDGSTPARQRKRAVDAFQNGEGDVFLISLKAGGAGLNLTAADYVIHMDPWWNPAVEDQASDRAHRMGQQRPVTIYRMVAKNTIEEKILSLHEQKRDLADSLLEGSEMSGRMSVDEMMALINEA